MDKNYYIELIIKEISQEISIDETRKLNAWLAESEENEKAKIELIRTWESANKYKSDINVNTESAWEKVEKSIGTRSVSLIPFYAKKSFKIAAAVLVLFGMTFFMLNSLNQPTTYSASNKAVEIELPDGSLVWLNEYSELTYKQGITQRNVSLVGEAFFDVVHNPNKPFIVSAKGSETTVLGTEFNVEANYNSPAVIVSLLEGSIAFATDESEKVLLVPGETVNYNSQSALVEKYSTKDANVLSWKTGVLVFEKTNLPEVLNELESYYNQDINLQISEQTECMFTGTFEQASFEEVIEILSYSFDLEYELQNNEHFLNIKNCN